MKNLNEHIGCTRRKDEPVGYVKRGAWFKKMSKTHNQKKCKRCDLYHIWSRKVKIIK